MDRLKIFFSSRDGNRESTHAEVVDFLEMKEAERAVLEQRIRDWQGLIRCFVHPDYDVRKDGTSILRPIDAEKTRQMRLMVEKMLCLDPAKIPPVFLLLEMKKKNIPHFFQMAADGNKPYVVPTLPDESTPRLNFMSRFKHPDKVFGNFSKMLEGLGVKKIILGGMFFVVVGASKSLPAEIAFNRPKGAHFHIPGDCPEKDLFLYLKYCGGYAAERLSKDFELQISNFAFPDSHGTIRKVEREISKQFSYQTHRFRSERA